MERIDPVMMALALLIAVVLIGLVVFDAGRRYLNRGRRIRLRLCGIVGIIMPPTETNLDPSKVTDLIAFGKFESDDPSKTVTYQLLTPAQYSVAVTNKADGTVVNLVSGATADDHAATVNGIAEDVPVGTACWQTPAEVAGVDLLAKFTLILPDGTTAEDDEESDFVAGAPVLVGLAGVDVQE